MAGVAFIASLDGVVLQEGEASFVNEGEIEVREPIGDGVDRWQQRLLLLDRYLVRLDFHPGTTASSPVNSKSGSKPTVRC